MMSTIGHVLVDVEMLKRHWLLGYSQILSILELCR